MGTQRADISGKRFGSLVVIQYSHTNKWKESVWECKCDCGKTALVTAKSLNRGTKSCGCARSKNLIDLTGQRFGRWNVVSYSKGGWLCKCDCGTERVIESKTLRAGDSMSCGCLAKELARENLKTHGMSKTRLYKRWSSIIERCENIDNPRYMDYGGRGITVCNAWHDFGAFYEWAINNGYKESLQIDRIDNNKGYYPDNCRWVTRKENMRNRRNNVLMTYNGETRTIAEWSETTGIPYGTISRRVREGWLPHDALAIKPHKGNKKRR